LTVALSDYWLNTQELGVAVDSITGVSVAISILIGGLTFTGSIVAYLKLDGIISGQAITFKGQHLLNLILLIVAVVLVVLGLIDIGNPTYMITLGILSLLIGVLVVIPI